MNWKTLRGDTDGFMVGNALVLAYHLNDREVVLIDSGEEPSEELMEELDRRGLRVRAVLCTHLHIDHTANNYALHRRHGAELYAAEIEIRAAERQHWRMLPAGVRVVHKDHWVPAGAEDMTVPVAPIDRQGKRFSLEGRGFSLIPTPGHTVGHLAIVTPDGVCFGGDAMMTEDLLRASKLPYFADVDQAVESMEALRYCDYPLYALSHEGVVRREEWSGLIDRNVEKELDLYEQLRQLVKGAMPLEELLEAYMDRIGIRREVQKVGWIRKSVEDRVRALTQVGELEFRDGVVAPKGML